MLKYLEDVDSWVNGDDLSQIKKMLSLTSQSVEHHIGAYSNIKKEVDDMNGSSTKVMGRLAKHDEEVKRVLEESEKMRREINFKVAIPEVDEEEERP